MKVGRGDACSGTYQDKIIVVGGFSEENFCKPLNSVEIYDPVTKTWETGPSFDVARGDAACGNYHFISTFYLFKLNCFFF